jgi:hypothetical protein
MPDANFNSGPVQILIRRPAVVAERVAHSGRIGAWGGQVLPGRWLDF